MRRLTTPLVVLSLFVIAGCQYDPYAHRFTTSKPAFEDLTGIYRFNEQTATNDPIGQAGIDSYISLKADSTYEVKNIPDVFNTDSATGKINLTGYYSTHGKWEISSVGSVDYGSGLDKHWGLLLTGFDKEYASIGLMGNKPPYEILVTLGDPDAGEVMIFSKE
ncbi:hypothetical protein [Chitinophaga rhizophila]|uniref:Lipocalin-like domain-containing protein n=1 Tax=Chitinophaga rhizophila TaxID=2866212 RepID=A0ABS7GFK6_9BACT|nr:hypothetical protein [Chitinophaga rhizophila]MBW8686469.1 hypothetical protein [Chitinophaga rhizophila]